MKKILNCWRGWRTRMQMRRMERRKMLAMDESHRRIQLKEYGGVLHVSFDGIPLIDTRELNCGDDISEVLSRLSSIRETYALYMLDLSEGGMRKTL